METKRELQRDFSFQGKNYRVKKMDARQACFVAFQLKAFIPSVMAFLAAESAEKDDKTMAAGNTLASVMSCNMPRKDFFQLQNDCLSSVYHVEAAGEIAVLTSTGDFINSDLGTDAQAVLVLFLQSLAFNVKGFFDAAFQTEFGSTIRSMTPSTAQTSTNS